MTTIYGGTSFVEEKVVPALEKFEEALTKRWRIDACEAMLTRDVIPLSKDVSWDYTSDDAWDHISTGDCAFIAWVDDGQHGSLSAVSCPGVPTATRT